MFRETVSHLKDLPRYRQILATLIRDIRLTSLTLEPPKPRMRLQRTLVTFAVLAVLAFIGFVFIAGRGE